MLIEAVVFFLQPSCHSFLLVKNTWHTSKLFMALLFTTASDLGSLSWPLHLCSSKQGLQEDDPPGKEYVIALTIHVQNWVDRGPWCGHICAQKAHGGFSV